MKKHTKQNHKQKNGQFFTINSDHILCGFEFIVKGKMVIDPFAGGKDLLKWADKNGATSTIGYDIEPTSEDIIQNDSIAYPPSYEGVILITNPPYLAKNKFKGGKSIFDIWDQNDLYKCHLASLEKGNCEEAIIILPSNFLCESGSKARDMLFKNYYIVSAKYWNEPIFEDATTGICVIHIKRGIKPYQEFELRHEVDNLTIKMHLEKKYNYLHGKEFFDYIQKAPNILNVVKTDIGMEPPNTSIVVGLLDYGKWRSGLSYNEGPPIYSQPTCFTTYQLTFPNLILTEYQQRDLIETFNKILSYYRKKYHDMFLSNFMGPKQKILSRKFINKLIEMVLIELGIIELNTIENFLHN